MAGRNFAIQFFSWFFILSFVSCSEKRDTSPTQSFWRSQLVSTLDTLAPDSLLTTSNSWITADKATDLCQGLSAPALFNCQPRYVRASLLRLKTNLRSVFDYIEVQTLLPGTVTTEEKQSFQFSIPTFQSAELEFFRPSTGKQGFLGFYTQPDLGDLTRLVFFNVYQSSLLQKILFDFGKFQEKQNFSTFDSAEFGSDSRVSFRLEVISENSWTLSAFVNKLPCLTDHSRRPVSEYWTISSIDGVQKIKFSGLVPALAQNLPTDTTSQPNCLASYQETLPADSNSGVIYADIRIQGSAASLWNIYWVPGDANADFSDLSNFSLNNACDRFGWTCGSGVLDLSSFLNPHCLDHSQETGTWNDNCSSLNSTLNSIEPLPSINWKSFTELKAGPTLDLSSDSQSINLE